MPPKLESSTESFAESMYERLRPRRTVNYSNARTPKPTTAPNPRVTVKNEPSPVVANNNRKRAAAKKGRKPKAAMKPSRAYLEDHKEVKPKPLEKPLCFPIAPFKRLILEILSSVRKDHYGIDDEAVEAIQTEAEETLCRLFQSARLVGLEAGRNYIKLTDFNAIWGILKINGCRIL